MADHRVAVAVLEEEWGAIEGLISGLDAQEMATPSCLPGWSVADVIAHIVGTELMLAGEQPPEPDDAANPPAKPPANPPASPSGNAPANPIAEINELWVRPMRKLTPQQLVDRYRAATSARIKSLKSMTTADFANETMTPVGMAPYSRFMEIRVFDCWMHEQDIRYALDKPGHDSGQAAEMSISEIVGGLGLLVGKRAGAPDGSSVTITLTGPVSRTIHVKVDGRAAVVDKLDGPARAGLMLDSNLFTRLAGGRVEPQKHLSEITMTGDQKLAEQVATHLRLTI